MSIISSASWTLHPLPLGVPHAGELAPHPTPFQNPLFDLASAWCWPGLTTAGGFRLAVLHSS